MAAARRFAPKPPLRGRLAALRPERQSRLKKDDAANARTSRPGSSTPSASPACGSGWSRAGAAGAVARVRRTRDERERKERRVSCRPTLRGVRLCRRRSRPGARRRGHVRRGQDAAAGGPSNDGPEGSLLVDSSVRCTHWGTCCCENAPPARSESRRSTASTSRFRQTARRPASSTSRFPGWTCPPPTRRMARKTRLLRPGRRPRAVQGPGGALPERDVPADGGGDGRRLSRHARDQRDGCTTSRTACWRTSACAHGGADPPSSRRPAARREVRQRVGGARDDIFVGEFKTNYGV